MPFACRDRLESSPDSVPALMSVVAASFSMALASRRARTFRRRNGCRRYGQTERSSSQAGIALVSGAWSAQARWSWRRRRPGVLRRRRLAIHDRPVGHVLEQQVWVVLQIGRKNKRSGQPGNRPGSAPARSSAPMASPAAKGDEAAAVDHLAANVEIRADHQHGGPEVARPGWRHAARRTPRRRPRHPPHSSMQCLEPTLCRAQTEGPHPHRPQPPF